MFGMNISKSNRLLIKKVELGDKIYVELNSGDILTLPFSYTKKLENASENDLKDYRLIGGGIGIHFLKIDEDISLSGIINYKTTQLLAS
jgi:hypothetical protein